MRFFGRSILGVALLALTAGFLALAAGTVRGALEERAGGGGGGPGGRPPPGERVVAAQVVAVEPGALTPVTTAFGEVQAARALELRAPAGGRVVEMSPSMVEGGVVRSGEVLVRLDPTDAESALARIRADEGAAKADIADAERNLALAGDDLAAAEEQLALRQRAQVRAEDLASRGVGTAADREAAELAAASARQVVLSRRQAEATAQTRLDQARVAADRLAIDRAEAERRLEDLTVVAAFDGRLAEVGVTTLGALVSANEHLARLVDPGSLEVSFRLSAAQYARLGDPVGQPVEVSLDIGGAEVAAAGRIVRVGAEVGEGRTGRLLFAALDAGEGLRPGDFVTVRVTEPELRGVARLPAGAVGADGTVLALGAEDRLEEAPAEVLRRQGDEVIVAASGLEGREVVAERSPLLGAGIRIEPLRAGEALVSEAPRTVRLDDERRARLIAFVEGNQRMPADVKGRILATLQEEEVPVETVERIEGRMGG